METTSAVYLDLDQETLDREYSPGAGLPDPAAPLDGYARDSAAVRAGRPWQTYAYGDLPVERLDFYPAAVPDAPLHVFVPGGFWCVPGRSTYAFPAPGLLRYGAAFATLDHGTAPTYRFDEMAAMVRRSLAWLVDNASALGVDPRRIYVSGSAGGAHLLAMCLTTTVDAEDGDPRDLADLVCGVSLLSGVYDL